MRTLGIFAAAVAAVFIYACDGRASVPGLDTVSAQELRRAVDDPRVKTFYEQRGWKPAWSGGARRDLMDAIEVSERHGIQAARFLADIDQAEGAEEEAALTLAAISYAEALATGMTDPGEIWDLYTIERPTADVVAGLGRAVEAGNVGEWLEGLAPRDAEYRAMSEAYMGVRERLAESEARPIPPGDLIKAGGRDPRLPQIAVALRQAGFFAGPVDPPPTTYTPDMVAAVEALQREAGLRVDGVIGDNTLGALSTVLSDRARQLALNLERRRWLPRQAPGTRIDVNTAASRLRYYRDGQVAHTARVVNGKASTATPQLQSNLYRLVANPPWNVPQGIAEEEILPKGQAYLRQNDMYIKDGRVIQRPGPKAALGVVKFDMDNKYAIYLHDTPAKSLFASSNRHRSHGCVRVEDAVEFARMLAREQGKLDEFNTALASGETSFVPLGAKIPVRLLYHTVYLDDAGRLAFAADPYGWDERLAKALDMPAPSRRRITEEAVSIELGP